MRYPRTIKSGSAVVRIYRTRHKSTASGFVFQVSYVAAGVRKLHQFASETDAEEEARLRAGQLAAGRIEAATIGKPDRDELAAARQILGKKGQLLPALREWVKAHDLTEGHITAAAEAWAARNSSKLERIKVADLVKKFLSAKTGAGVHTVKNHGHLFKDIKTDFGTYYLDSITAPQIGTWLAKREHPSTRNTYRKHTVSLWRWAQKQGYLPRDARTEAEQTDRAIEGPNEIGIISAETYGALLVHFRAKHPEYLAALTLAGFCGMRRSEIHGQAWSDIDLARKFVRVTKAKRGTPSRRLVPLPDAAVAWLMLCKDRKGDVCDNLAMDRIRDIARVPRADSKDDKPLFDLPENCFRHGFISHRVAQTGNVQQTALEAGNSPTIIFKHYLELVTKAEGEAWFAITPTEAEGDLHTLDQVG